MQASIPETRRRRITTGTTIFAALAAVVAFSVTITITSSPFLGALVVGLLVVLAAICVRPTSATVVFLFLMYINAPAVAVKFHGVPELLAAATVGLLGIPVFYYVVMKREPFYVDSVLPWLLAFCGVQLLSMLFAANKAIAMETFITFLAEGVILYLLVSNAVRTTRVTWALIAACAFMGALVVFQKATGTYWRDYKGFAQVSEQDWNSWNEIEGGRWPSGPIGDKNYYAQFMLMILPLALFQFWNERLRILRLAGLASAIAIVAGIALSGSRGAVIGIAGMLMVMIALGYVKMRHLAALGVVASLLLIALPQYRERVTSLASVVDVVQRRDLRQADTAIQGRFTEMAAAVLVFLEHPLLGVGPGNFPAYFPDKADVLGFTVHGVERRAHCLYLEVAAEMGIPGLLCLSAILSITGGRLYRAYVAARSKKMRGLAAAALAALVAMMVTALFLSMAYIRYFWLMIGLCSAITRIIHQQSRDGLEQACDPHDTLSDAPHAISNTGHPKLNWT